MSIFGGVERWLRWLGTVTIQGIPVGWTLYFDDILLFSDSATKLEVD